LTDEQFGQQLQEQNQRKETEAAQKAQRMEGREAQRAVKASLEAEWKETKAKHQQAVEAWKLECDRLRKDGVLVKNLPAKPKCPRKPKPAQDGPSTQPEPPEEEEESSDDDDDDDE
jgi:hypothetical protein